MNIHVARAVIPALGWRRVQLAWNGTVTRSGRQRWTIKGPLQLRHAPGALLGNGRLTMSVDTDADTIEVEVDQGRAEVSAALPLDEPTHAQIRLQHMPLRWLQGLLARAWQGGRLQQGRVDGRFAFDALDNGVRSSGAFALTGGAFDSAGGNLAGQGVRMGGRLRLDTTGRATRIDLDSTLRGGQVLLGPLYAQLPTHAVRLSVSASAARSGVRLNRLSFDDPGALHLDGRVDLSTAGEVTRLALSRVDAHLPQAYDRYGKAWLSTLGIEHLQSRGSVHARLDLDSSGPQSFAFATDGLTLADGGGRFAIDGLRGSLDWSRHGSLPATTLSWNQLRFYRIVNGAATAHWRSHDGTLALQAPLRVPLFDGQLILPSLDWRPAAGRGRRLEMSMAVTDISIPKLCKAFGWPEFKGTLGGAIPGLRYVGNRFELDGGLSLNVFGGFVDVTRLSVQQPFGSTPVLAGDMSMRDLDLGQITGVFDFGRITGRMNGKVQHLRLVNWQPVSFDAELTADGGGRISQRAVNNLTSVGGGGVAAGLQGAVLKLFDSFGYSRIGLRCQLKGSVCRMSGLKPVNGGYAIVEGRGLPYLNVIGHQSRVSWPTLVSRLQAAIKGGGPVVK